jgi:predicted flap endonuclease-1-like 5' DNA nuclease
MTVFLPFFPKEPPFLSKQVAIREKRPIFGIGPDSFNRKSTSQISIIMEYLLQFLNGTTEEQNIVLLSFILTAFLLGLFLAWAVQNTGIRKLEGELRRREDALKASEKDRLQLEEELALKGADLKRSLFEREESHAELKLLQQDHRELQEELGRAQVELDKSLASARQYLSTIEDLNDQILGLKTRNAQLGIAPASPAPAVGDNFAETRLAALEARLRLLEEGKNPASAPEVLDARQREVFPDAPASEEEEPDLSLRAFQSVTAASRTAAAYQDDLTAIEGIGPFLQQKLYEAGIFTYAQISAWEDAEVEEITKKIQFFPGRIRKDDWVGQAKRLLESDHPASRSLFLPDAEDEVGDDLKIIEGIGPSVEAVLKKAGLDTFEALAQADPDEIETILLVSDPHLALFDADTWPAQASMARHGEWETLQAFQENLRAGRPVRDEDMA